MLEIAICIDVSDLAEATKFYCEALGCELKEKKGSHNTLSAAGTIVHLSAKDAGSNATPSADTRRRFERHWTPVHVDFYVEDVDAITPAVERLGGTVESTKSGDWGKAAFCADPYGNGFCLLAIDPSMG